MDPVKTNEDFQTVDQRITRQILTKFEGEIVEQSCGYCYGKGCPDCDHTGAISIEY